MPKKHIIIFSHGFGVKKDARGLFTDIVAALPEAECLLFDYNKIDEEKNTVTVQPFSAQAAKLQDIALQARAENPAAIIDIVCHSQGSIVAALAHPQGIRKFVFIAPPFISSSEKMIANFEARPGTTIDRDGLSYLSRQDGTTTVIPPEYWSEKETVVPARSYSKLSEWNEVVIITANQDDVLVPIDSDEVECSEMIALDGDHNFSGNSRAKLIETLVGILSLG